MKPRNGSEQGEFRGLGLDGASSERSGDATVPGSEPGHRRALVEPQRSTTDLAAWLDALDPVDVFECDSLDSFDEEDGASNPDCREADELLLALAVVDSAPRVNAESSANFARMVPFVRQGLPSRQFDARVLAERLLAEIQQHDVFDAHPEALLAAHVGTASLSLEALDRLLEGLATTSQGCDEGALTGASERGLLALLALQLYVHEAASRPRVRHVVQEPQDEVVAPVVHDSRLLESLAVPHEATRPLGERRPRGRPYN